MPQCTTVLPTRINTLTTIAHFTNYRRTQRERARMRDKRGIKIIVTAHAMTMHDNDRRILATRCLPQPITVHVTKATTKIASTQADAEQPTAPRPEATTGVETLPELLLKIVDAAPPAIGEGRRKQRPESREPHFAPPADRDWGHSGKLLCSCRSNSDRKKHCAWNKLVFKCKKNTQEETLPTEL